MKKRYLFIAIPFILAIITIIWLYSRPDVVVEVKNTVSNLPYTTKQLENKQKPATEVKVTEEVKKAIETKDEPSAENIELITPPTDKILPASYHIFQTFNNCGPASLSMALSYYGINVSQKTLGEELRPYQNPKGDNDDKSTTLTELASKAEEYGFVSYYRPNGDINLIKLFITYDIPVITKTWLHKDEDIGHFRIVKGYDETEGVIIQDDSFEGKNLKYTYGDFNDLWKHFDYSYLVLIPADKLDIAKMIIGENVDEFTAWNNAVINSQKILASDPDDVNTRFNLAIEFYNIGEYQKAVDEFEIIENKLTKRALWYHIEPIRAYFELGDYQSVFDITDKILNGGNRAYTEAYLLRGKIYENQGKLELAKEEYEKSVLYNTANKEAKESLDRVQ